MQRLDRHNFLSNIHNNSRPVRLHQIQSDAKENLENAIAPLAYPKNAALPLDGHRCASARGPSKPHR